jgi:hypothetical protein
MDVFFVGISFVGNMSVLRESDAYLSPNCQWERLELVLGRGKAREIFHVLPEMRWRQSLRSVWSINGLSLKRREQKGRVKVRGRAGGAETCRRI